MQKNENRTTCSEAQKTPAITTSGARVPTFTKRAVICALLKSYGNITEASRYLIDNNTNIDNIPENVSAVKDSLYRKFDKDKTGEYAQAIYKGRATLVDEAEGQLARHITDGDKGSIKFALETIGKDRGYFKKKALDNKVLGELDMNTNISGEVKVIVIRKTVTSKEEAQEFISENRKTKGEKDIGDEFKKKSSILDELKNLDISKFMKGE